MPQRTTKSATDKRLDTTRAKIVAAYTKLAEKTCLHPSFSDLIRVTGITRNTVRYYFGTIHDLADAAKKANPKAFHQIVDGDLFSYERFGAIKEEVTKHRRFVVTTAITGAKVHAGFLAAIKTYCRENDAVLLVLPNLDPASIVARKRFLDPVLTHEFLVGRDLRINKNLFISSIKLSAKHIDPITGLGRIGQREGSFIYASPKQRLKMVATSNNGLPHALMTTGALTLPAYDSDRYMSHRTSYIAEHDHIIGAVVVEVQDDRRFHFRQVQADKQGRFADLDRLYSADGSTAVTPEALVLGDWHSRQNDPVARAAFVDGVGSLRDAVRPRVVVLHDGFDGLSISHHEEGNVILKARRANALQLSLEEELRLYAKDLDFLASKFERVVVVQSNHDEFLHRYLSEGRYVDDHLNHGTALRLASAMVDSGRNPVQVGVEMFGLKHGDRITFLSRDEDYKVAGIELGAHGDKGANGSRGSLRAMEAAYGSSVSGHAHTPEILRSAYQVGTCSILRPDYAKGPSSWLHTSCLVYRSGARQLVNVIDGAWRAA